MRSRSRSGTRDRALIPAERPSWLFSFFLAVPMHPTPFTRASLRAACAILFLSTACPAASRSDDPAPPPPAAPATPAAPTKSGGGNQPQKAPAPPTASDSKAEEPGWVEVEGLGLRIKPPQPALGRSETVNGVLRYEIADGAESPRWWMRLQTLVSSRGGLTAEDQVKAYLAALTKNGKSFTVKFDEPLTPQGATGEGRLAIIESPLPEGGSGMSGWAIIPNGEDRYLVASIVASASTFDATFPSLRECLRAVRIISTDAIAAERRERIDRGTAIVRFSEQVMRGAIQEEPLLFRVYRPGKPDDTSDDVELGWMTVRAIEGMRGEVDGARNREELAAEERDAGLLVIVQAKTVIDNDSTNIVDTESRYWVSWDRGSEMWSIRSTQRQREASRTTGQTGVRTPPRHGDPRPILRVVNPVGVTEPLEWVVPPNYLSQAELIMLGRLLPKSDPKPLPYASYAFDPKTNGLPQRLDELHRNDDGTWTLETHIGTAPTPLVQTFDEKGNRIRRVDADAAGAVVTERIGVDALKALWQRKGLPIS